MTARDSFGTVPADGSTLADLEPGRVREWARWLAQYKRTGRDYLQFHSFSGVDIKAAIWIPPTSENTTGTYKKFAELQTLTVSSERPAGPVRSCGVAEARDYIRGVRTIAGSLVFTVFDRDVFADVYQRADNEAPADFPIFVDQIPKFHIILDAATEHGFTANTAIIDMTLTNFGTTYSVDDLMLEATYTYVARYMTPFSNKNNWRAGLASVISRYNAGIERASQFLPSRRRRGTGQRARRDLSGTILNARTEYYNKFQVQ